MSREIKFRAWCPKCSRFEPIPLWEKENLSEEDDFSVWMDNLVIEQYTGLKDKNGREIYEGDIVEYVTHYYGNENRHRKVVEWGEWDSDDFGEPHNLGYFNLSEVMEVIGNIHENPELLGGDE